MKYTDKNIIIAISLIPLSVIVWDALNGQLGSKPIEAISQRTGNWSLLFLLMTLSITPLKKLFAWSHLVRYRKLLGLTAFFYASLHISTYLVLDHAFNLSEILSDIAKRPYIALGLLAFLLTIPLAITSTSAMKKRLGKQWKTLHQLIYPVGLLGIVHYLWLVKKDFTQPLLYASLFLFLMAVRVWDRQMSTGKIKVTSNPKHNVGL
jgi:sulfoxide reductase heme-binding subunit YedZ